MPNRPSSAAPAARAEALRTAVASPGRGGQSAPLAGHGSPLIRALAAGVQVQLAATYPGTRHLERRLKRWHKTGQFCASVASGAAAEPTERRLLSCSSTRF
jgi:hypothetical protein